MSSSDQHSRGQDGGERNGAAAPTPRPRRSPGFSNRRHREMMEKAVIRETLERAHPHLRPAEMETEVQARYRALVPSDPRVRKYFDETAQVSVCPSRRGIFQLVEAKAVRELAQMQELEQLLRVCAYGRPTDRRLVAAAFERNFLENGRPEVISHYKDFSLANEPLHWAYDYPARSGSMRDQSSVYRTLHSTLARCDPEVCLRLNVEAVVALREQLGEPDIGRYLVIDGTAAPAPREQRGADPGHPVEEAHLRRGLESATFASHSGRKRWRGYRLIFITDIKTGLPLGFCVLPASRPEWECLQGLLEAIHSKWEQAAGEPWEPEYLVGDGHFDIEPVHRLLEERFAIHPVFARGIELGREHDWHENEGTPYCAAHGDMKLVQSQYFVDHAKRRELGLAPGEAADLSQASFRWTCTHPGCPVKATTSWNRNPRAYTFLPRKGEHRSRVALRRALMLRRNVSESLNASLKGRGIGNGGMNTPRWVSSDREMLWLCYAFSLSYTLLRLAHETGAYARAHSEADQRGLLVPCEPGSVSAATASSGRVAA